MDVAVWLANSTPERCGSFALAGLLARQAKLGASDGMVGAPPHREEVTP